MVKFIGMLKRKAGMTMEEFSEHWYENHAPLVLKLVPGVQRYVQNHVVRLPGGGEPRFDGTLEIWFDGLESWRKTQEWYFSDDGKVLRNDEERFIDLSKSVFVVTEERVIKP